VFKEDVFKDMRGALGRCTGHKEGRRREGGGTEEEKEEEKRWKEEKRRKEEKTPRSCHAGGSLADTDSSLVDLLGRGAGLAGEARVRREFT